MKKNFKKNLILGICTLAVILNSCGVRGMEQEESSETSQYAESLANKSPLGQKLLDGCFKEFKDKYINRVDVLMNSEDYDFDTLAYAGYLNLINHGYTIEDVEDELNNIAVYATFPTEVDVETFNMLVGKLNGTLSFHLNPFSIYYPLAYKVHLLSCDLEHQELYENVYFCENIFEDLTKNLDENAKEEAKEYVRSLVK